MHDVYTAQEAFLTSTSFCILPATSVNDVPFGDGAVPGPVTETLQKAWFELVGVDFVGQARAHLEVSTPA
jgi:branched-chain amino acid aminotransferase